MSKEIVEIKEADLPQKLKALWLKALSAVELQNHSYAISLCQAILKDEPGYVDARKLARKCAVVMQGGAKKKKGNAVTQMFSGGFSASKLQNQAKKDAVGALVALEKELEKEPYSDQLNEILYDVAIRLNLLETAAFALETVRKGAPENTKLLHKLAEFYLARDMPAEASDVYQDITKQDPSDIHAVKGYKDSTARASMKKDNWSEDASLADITRDQDEAAKMEDASRTALTRDQMRDRLASLMEQYQADQNNLSVVKQIAKLYEDMEYWPDSYVFYNWAYELSNKDSTLKNKADQMKAKATAENIQQLEEQLKADPDNAELKAELETLKQDQAAEAIADAQARVDQNPTDPQLRFELGSALYHAGNFNEAIPHLQQAKRNPHIRTRVLLTLGRCFDEKGMHDIALNQLKEALEDLSAMDGVKKEVLYEMGQISSKMGDAAAALEYYKPIYEADYGYRDVAKLVEEAYSGN